MPCSILCNVLEYELTAYWQISVSLRQCIQYQTTFQINSVSLVNSAAAQSAGHLASSLLHSSILYKVMHKLTQCICVYRSDDIQLISANSLVAGEPGKPCSNLLNFNKWGLDWNISTVCYKYSVTVETVSFVANQCMLLKLSNPLSRG